jgi:hypothetical protein
MQPAVVTVVERLPLTRTGKLDRDALPNPEASRAAGDRGPRTGTEHEVHQIWCRILGRRECGVREKFFDTGGNSLSLIAIHGELARLAGAELPVATLFERSTIEQMAEAIDELRLVSATAARSYEL